MFAPCCYEMCRDKACLVSIHSFTRVTHQTVSLLLQLFYNFPIVSEAVAIIKIFAGKGVIVTVFIS